MSNIVLDDFDKICRMCLKQDPTLINIFFSEVSEIIASTTKIELKEGDRLPETICMTCMDKFVEFYRFKQLCENSDSILHSVLILHQQTDTVEELHNYHKIPEQFRNNETIQIESNDTKEVIQLKNDLVNNECGLCRLKVKDFNAHIEEYHPVNGGHYCVLCSKQQSSVYGTTKQLIAHLKYHKKPPKFQCEHCKKWFKYAHQRKIHMRTHTGERPAICTVCDKTFADPRYLGTHLKSHAAIKTNQCPVCQKTFALKSTLTVHLKAHSDVRAHMCSKCGKTFKHNHNLKIHMRLHTGEKPYNCRLCFTSFISASVLSAHMLTHTDEKRFSCSVCHKTFKRSGDLNIHMRCHTGEKPYTCTLCGNKYRMASHLREHLKTHSGEKNYVCEICSKAFYNGKALRVHKVSHDGQKTFHCNECQRSFVHNTSLFQVGVFLLVLLITERTLSCDVTSYSKTQSNDL